MEGNNEVETARQRLQAATTQVVATTTNLQMQQKHIEMQRLLLDNAQSMVNAANKEYNDALAMLSAVEKRCGIASTGEEQEKKADNTIEHKIYHPGGETNHAPHQSTIRGKEQSMELFSDCGSNKRRKVSLNRTAAAASSLGQLSAIPIQKAEKGVSLVVYPMIKALV